MNPNGTPSCSTQPLHALRERIEHETPWLHIVRCAQHPYPYLEVHDTSNYDIHVGLATISEWLTYVQIVQRGRRSA